MQQQYVAEMGIDQSHVCTCLEPVLSLTWAFWMPELKETEVYNRGGDLTRATPARDLSLFNH